MSRRIGLLGDVHAADGLLERAIAHLRSEGVDEFICVGDIVDGDGDPNRCVELLVDAEVTVVRGNHDRWLLDDTMATLRTHSRDDLARVTIDFLERLPSTLTIDTDAGDLLLCHGVGADDMFFLRPWTDGYDLEQHDELQAILRGAWKYVVCGHTHEPMDRVIGGVRFINPGCISRMPTPSVALLDVTNDLVQQWTAGPDGEFFPT